jgi:hypothetical protein
MSFRSISEKAAGEVFEALGVSPGEAQKNEVLALIEKAVIETALEAKQHHTKAARGCCSADRDLAHKIADQIEKAHVALVANLSAMR